MTNRRRFSVSIVKGRGKDVFRGSLSRRFGQEIKTCIALKNQLAEELDNGAWRLASRAYHSKESPKSILLVPFE